MAEPYFTDEEIAAIAARHGCDVPALKKRWIIQSGKNFYVMGADGLYKSPIMRSELLTSLMRDLQRVPGPSKSPAGIAWYKKRGDDDVDRPLDEFLKDYCGHARQVVACMSLAETRFDALEEKIYEAVCPLAKIEPAYDPQIARWLELLGGPQHERLLDWIATLTHLDRPSSALLITGKSGAGKELLAQGLARRWKHAKTPTELDRVLDGFNEDLARCPLVFCDETLPTKKGKKVALGDLKKMIAACGRTLSRKFLSNTDLVGAARFIFCANNNQMLASHDDQSEDEQESIAVRFLHILATREPVDYLLSLGSWQTTRKWVDGGAIARHAAWLEASRTVESTTRLLVQGDATNIQRQLIVNNKWASLVLEWIVRYIEERKPSTRDVLVGNGEVAINATTIQTQWNAHVRSDFAPSTSRIGAALGTLAMGQRRFEWPEGINGHAHVRAVRYHAVNPEFIYEWAAQNQVGDPAHMKQRIESVLDMHALRTHGSAPYLNGVAHGSSDQTPTLLNAQSIAQTLGGPFDATASKSLLDS